MRSYSGSEIKRRVYSNIHMLCHMKMGLKLCSQIILKYSNLSAHLQSQSGFLFHFLIPHDSVAIRMSKETTD